MNKLLLIIYNIWTNKWYIIINIITNNKTTTKENIEYY